MPRIHPIKNSFVAGELSPRLEGRDDLEQYNQAMRQAENGVVLPHGGYMRRSGSHFAREVKDSSKQTILGSFEFSVEQAYTLEIGDLYYRFYSNEGIVGAPFEVVTPYAVASDDLYDLQFAQEADVQYTIHPNHPPYKLTRLTATTFSFAAVAWSDGKAPLLSPNLSATTLTITGAGPYTLTFSAATLDAGTSDNGRAVRVEDATNEAWFDITSTSSTTVATATLGVSHAIDDPDTAGGVPAGANDNWQLGMFSDEDGARGITFHEGRLWFLGCKKDLNRVAGSNSDDFERFGNDKTADDNAVYRRVGAGRVPTGQWLASSDEALMIGTAGGEFILEPTADSILTPSSAKVIPTTGRGSAHIQPIQIDNVVHFLQRSGRALRQFTFNIQTDRRVAREISILAEHIFEGDPVVGGGGGKQMAYQQDPDSLAWVVRADGQLVGFTIETEQKVIGAARHIFGGSFGEGDAQCMSVAVIPDPAGTQDQTWVIVKRTIDGATVQHVEFIEDQFRPFLTPRSTTLEKINALKTAWFYDSALNLDSPLAITGITQADPAVVSVVNTLSNGERVYLDGIRGMTELNDRQYLVANVTGTTIELQNAETGVDEDATGHTAYASDGEVREMVTTISGLTHLEGETVGILADGGSHPDKTVSSAAITLDNPAARIVVGLKYKYRGETERFVVNLAQGSTQTAPAAIQRIRALLHNTLGLKFGVGPNPSMLEDIFREGEVTLDRPPPLITGVREVSPEGSWNDDATIYFEKDDGLPATVLALVADLEVDLT